MGRRGPVWSDGWGVRRSRRRWPVVTVAAGMAVLAAACGRGSSDPGPPTVLRVLMTDDWVTAPFVSAVRDFERSHPNLRVDVDRAQISVMIDTVTAAIKSGVSPDVVQEHAFSAAAQGLAQPVDDLWARKNPLDTSQFLPGAIDDVTWAGRLYGVPLDTNALFLLYDSEQFAAANVTPPDGPFTFETFEAAARALTSPDGRRRALAIPTSTWWTYGWIKANGGEVLDVGADGTVRVTLDDPGVVGALDFLGRLVRNNLAFAPTAANSSSGDALALFQAGSASAMASGSWDLAKIMKQAPGDRYRSTLMPAGPSSGTTGSVMGGSSMFVPTGSRQRELAFEFMAHLVSDKYAVRLAKEEGRLPVRPRVYDDPHFKRPELKAVIEQLPTASPFKLSAFPEAHDIFENAIDKVLRGNEDAAAVMAEAQRQAEALPQRRR